MISHNHRQLNLQQTPVIVATSGRYTTDAVSFVEMRRAQQDVPTVELWAENDVEMMLARRPHIAAEFGLR